MQLPMKLAIGSGSTFFFILIFGFIVFPNVLKGKIKSMTPVVPGNEIRDMFVKVPFPLDFNIYFLNVTNTMNVQKGQAPIFNEIGPFCYEEWKEKVDVTDNDTEDTMTYRAKDTFLESKKPGCVSSEETVTILHPLITGIAYAVLRDKPGALGLINKAFAAIFNPESVYLTAKAKDLIFGGITINCDQKDFAARTLCSQLKDSPAIKSLSDTELSFSLLGPKNATPSKVYKVWRGKKKVSNLGAVIEYDGKKEMEVWPTKECNQYRGTDGTIFPPFLKAQGGVESFAADLCRSLAATRVGNTKYNGIPVWIYTGSLGDMSKNADEKCFCPTPDTCLKKGVMDLQKCLGVPFVVSLPHFYDSDESYLNAVKGLRPNKNDHEIVVYFEHITGAPVYAKKRLQFNLPMEPIQKIAVFSELPTLIHPIFWVEEAIALNHTFTKPLEDFFKIKKIVKISKWLILLSSLGGLGASGFLLFKNMQAADKPTVPKTKSHQAQPNGISRLGYGENPKTINVAEVDKY